MTSRPLLIAALLMATAAPAALYAQAADPGAAQVEALNGVLLDTMKQGKSLGVQGRYRKLEPAVQAAFDLPAMTRIAVGPTWASLTPQDQASLTKAFSRLTVANYAKNFDSFGGEKFTVDPQVETRGPDKLVHSQIVLPHDKPVDFRYRLRQGSDGRWKIIDVYYNGSISQLAARRSDFASSISKGAAALLQRIESLSDKLMQG
jgi:phospholipid transport system substrate-binding protein